MNGLDMGVYVAQFNRHQQYAEVKSDDPTMFRTFFLIKDHIAKKDKVVGLTNWTVGKVPPTIQVISPMRLAKIRSGTSY